MDDVISKRIRVTVEYIVNLLVRGAYDELELLSGGVRLKAEYMESGINDYGRTLISPPPSAYDNIDTIPIADTYPQEFSIRFRLHTLEEGESDLEIQLTLIDKKNPQKDELMTVEIDNILVA